MNVQELREALQKQTQETLQFQEDDAKNFSPEPLTRREGSSSPFHVITPSVPLMQASGVPPATMHSAMRENSTPPPTPSTMLSSSRRESSNVPPASSGVPSPSMHPTAKESTFIPPSASNVSSPNMRNLRKESSIIPPSISNAPPSGVHSTTASVLNIQPSNMQTITEEGSILSSTSNAPSLGIYSAMTESSVVPPSASDVSSSMRNIVKDSSPIPSGSKIISATPRRVIRESSIIPPSASLVSPSMYSTIQQGSIIPPSASNVPSSITRSVMKESTSLPSPRSVSGSPTKISFIKYESNIDNQQGSTVFPKKGSVSFSGRDSIETILDEYAQQVRDLQKKLSDATEQHEQQKYNLRQSIIELQTNLQDAIKEKNSLSELRRKESQSQEDLNFRLNGTISELQTANNLHQEMLKEANSQLEHLKEMVRSHEEVLERLKGVLMDYEVNTGKKVFENESAGNLHIYNLPAAFTKVLRDLETDILRFKGSLAPLEDELEAIRRDSESRIQLLAHQHQESIERLVNEHDQELEALSEKANSSFSHASNMQSQLEIVQEQAKNQNSLYARQIDQLENTVSQLRSELRESRRLSQDKIEDLEKQLHLAHSEMAEAQIERDQYSQETGNLDGQVHQLMTELHKKDLELNLEKEQNKRLWDRDTGSSITIDNLRRELDNKNMELQRLDSVVQSLKSENQGLIERQMNAIREKNESLEKISSLAVQQESTKEMLRKVAEELTEKRASLEAAEKQVVELTLCLQEKERVIESTNQEIQKLRGRVDGKLQELQQLKNQGDQLRNIQSECETLKLQLVEKDRMTEILRNQIDNMTQLVGQHGRTAGAMEMEKSQLLKEVTDKKMELQDLKVAQDKRDSKIRELEASLSELELEKVKLMNVSCERLRALKEMKLEREELVGEIKASRIELATLAEESEAMRNDYRQKCEEMECAVSKLRVQLKSAQFELEQTRATLKTMEGSDGHAMKVAMGMQKQITAKRGQIDALQSKIKFLEEAMANATKEKHYLKEERSKLSQELSCMAALNNKFASELEILKSQDKRLKEKLATMEAALDKASLQFAECQCIMQRQEQEVMRFKLQHTLDAKELQGPGYLPKTFSVKPQNSALPQAHSASAPASQAFAGYTSQIPSRCSSVKEDPLRDLKKLLQDLRSTIDEIPSAVLPRRDSNSDSDSVADDPCTTLALASRDGTGRRSQATYCRETAVRDLPSDTSTGESSTLHTADLEDPDAIRPFSSSAIFSSTPRYTSKKLSPEERYKNRSPVHSLLTNPLDDLKATPVPCIEHRSSFKKSGSPEATTSSAIKSFPFGAGSSIQTSDANGNMCRKLQNKMESLQNLVESLHLKNQAMSTMIRCQEKKIEKAKEKEKKLSK